MDASPQMAPSEPTADAAAANAGANAKGWTTKKKTTGPKPVQRRRRQVLSCMPCRLRKVRCAHGKPCPECFLKKRECYYIPANEQGQMLLANYKDNAGQNEMTLKNRITKGASASVDSSESDVLEDGEEEGGLQITPMVALDLTYDNYSDGNDLIDLGVRVGKMRITERIGGMNRPRISEEVCARAASISLVSLTRLRYEPGLPGPRAPYLRLLCRWAPSSRMRPAPSSPTS